MLGFSQRVQLMTGAVSSAETVSGAKADRDAAFRTVCAGCDVSLTDGESVGEDTTGAEVCGMAFGWGDMGSEDVLLLAGLAVDLVARVALP